MAIARRWLKGSVQFVTLGIVLVLAAAVYNTSQGTPGAPFNYLTYQGRVSDVEGRPVQGSKLFTFRLYEAAQGGTALWEDEQTLEVTNGVFTARLGSDTNPLNMHLGSSGSVNGPRYLGVTVSGSAELPRSQIVSVAYAAYAEYSASALTANSAGSAATVPWAGLTNRPTGLDDGDNDTTYTAGSNITIANNQISVNTSGLNADTVDNNHASDFAMFNHGHLYLPLSGGTLTGTVSQSTDPTLADHLARKGYVDSEISNRFDTVTGHNHDSVNSKSIFTIKSTYTTNSYSTPGYAFDGTTMDPALLVIPAYSAPSKIIVMATARMRITIGPQIVGQPEIVAEVMTAPSSNGPWTIIENQTYQRGISPRLIGGISDASIDTGGTYSTQFVLLANSEYMPSSPVWIAWGKVRQIQNGSSSNIATGGVCSNRVLTAMGF